MFITRKFEGNSMDTYVYIVLFVLFIISGKTLLVYWYCASYFQLSMQLHCRNTNVDILIE